MASDERTCTRRQALRTFAGGVAVLTTIKGCGADESGPRGESCPAVGPGSKDEGWVEVSLQDHPALSEVGGASSYQNPAALLDVVLVRAAEDCYLAIWRNCTHGACHVDWSAEARHLECPCHGSLFAEDGRVLRGPATRPLRTFPVVRGGDALWIHRPL